MAQKDEVTEVAIEEALARCAEEKVQIIGQIQPFGYICAFDRRTQNITHASEDIVALVDRRHSEIFGHLVGDIFGRHVWHGIRNAMSLPRFEEQRNPVGQYEIAGSLFELSAFVSGDFISVEFEPIDETKPVASNVMMTLSALMNEIQSCQNEQSLFETAAHLLRQLTGYDRVMAYQFDPEGNGTVIAESKLGRIEPFLGLRFPSWDIPVQARAIMMRSPIRVIVDVDANPVPVRGAQANTPPLDMTFGHLRASSPIHLQYLKNMGSKATMTMSVAVDGALWGMMSFHTSRPKMPTPEIRQIAETFSKILETRLLALRQTAQLRLAGELERVKADLEREIDADKTLDATLSSFAPYVLKVFEADGAALLSPQLVSSFGDVPKPLVIDALLKSAHNGPYEIVGIENLGERFPDLKEELDGIAGCLIAPFYDNRAICIFRRANVQKVTWAGAPEKEIEIASGVARLHPRASFARYPEIVKDRSESWTTRDHWIANKLWGLLVAADRRSLMNEINRKQELMINELNHRVRNILSLVRSVSRQTLRHYGSLESYSSALEARIQALAAAHDLGVGASLPTIPIVRLLMSEAEPYVAQEPDNVTIRGSDVAISAEVAPLFSLVIHELMTNCAKHGALSVNEGRVEIDMSKKKDGLEICWKEQGGPMVPDVRTPGFGTTLIGEAVPFELGGVTSLDFQPEGLIARIWLPERILTNLESEVTTKNLVEAKVDDAFGLEELPEPQALGNILIVEDNFMIANDSAQYLREMGFESVEIAADVSRAEELIADQKPDVAILDVYLGAHGTSLGLAKSLQKTGIPFFFVTAYGDQLELPVDLKDTIVLSKPVSLRDLKTEVLHFLHPS